MAAVAYSAIFGGIPLGAAHLQPLATQGIPLGKGRHYVEFPAKGLQTGVPTRGGHLWGLPVGQGSASGHLLLLQACPSGSKCGASPDDSAAIEWTLQRTEVGLYLGLSQVQFAGETGAHVWHQTIVRDVRAGPESGWSFNSPFAGQARSRMSTGSGYPAKSQSVRRGSILLGINGVNILFPLSYSVNIIANLIYGLDINNFEHEDHILTSYLSHSQASIQSL